MSRLYDLAQPFVGHPMRAFLVMVAVLALAHGRPRPLRRPLLVAAVSWAIFGLLEAEALRERADIRVDLLFTWPALCVTTIACMLLALSRYAATRRPPEAKR